MALRAPRKRGQAVQLEAVVLDQCLQGGLSRPDGMLKPSEAVRGYCRFLVREAGDVVEYERHTGRGSCVQCG